MAKQRIAFLDIAKGIGILAVFVGHVISPGCLVTKFISVWHMPLFFFISGLCYDADKYCGDGKRRFLVSRVRSLLWPLLLFTAVFALIGWATGFDYYTFERLALCQWPFAMWFLLSLFLTEVLYWLLCLVSRRAWWLGAVALVALGVSVMLQGRLALLPWGVGTPLIALPFYTCGHLLRSRLSDVEHFLGHVCLRHKALICLLLFAAIVGGLCFTSACFSIPDVRIPSPWMLSIAMTLMALAAVMVVAQAIDQASMSDPAPACQSSPVPAYRKVARSAQAFLLFAGKNTLTILIFHMWWIRLLHDFLRPLIGIGIEPLLALPLLYLTIIAINRYLPWAIGK